MQKSPSEPIPFCQTPQGFHAVSPDGVCHTCGETFPPASVTPQIICKFCSHVSLIRDGWLRHYQGYRCSECKKWNPAYGGKDEDDD